MNYTDKILNCGDIKDLDALFKNEFASAGNKMIMANTFCSDLEKLLATNRISFPSGGVTFVSYQGARVPLFQPNTILRKT